MNNSTKYRIICSSYLSKFDKNTYWTAYGINWVKDKESGIVFLKWKKNKIIGKCAFTLKDNLISEKLLNNYANIDCENILPTDEFMELCWRNFNSFEIMNWFEFKLFMNSKILSDEDYTPTLTTKQDRLPNSGIVPNHIKWNEAINHWIFKDNEITQLSLF